MRSRLVLTTLAALGLFIIDGVAANAAPPLTRYFISRSATSATDWGNQENWSAFSCTAGDDSGKPVVGDHVIICKGKTADIVEAADLGADDDFASLEIMEGATLNFKPAEAEIMTISGAGGLFIRTGGALNLDATNAIPTFELSNGGSHNVDGILKLENAGVILRFSGNKSILDGSGMIEGQDDGALIQIDSDKRLTVGEGFRIEGNLEIKENVVGGGTDPFFVNDGLVHANAGGGIILLTALTHLGTGEYRMSGNDANEVKFASGDATNQATFFNVRQGILNIVQEFYTSGGLRCADGGTSDVCVQCDAGENELCVFAGSGE